MDNDFKIKLTDDHKEVIQRNIKRLDKLEPAFDQAESCGVNCQERREHARVMREFFVSVQQAFFPDVGNF